MTKEVLIRISGSHQMDQDNDTLELIVAGEYYFKNGKHYLIYDEVAENDMKPVHNVVKIAGDSMEITKNGQIASKLQFDKKRKHVNCYATPYGEMIVGVDTRDIRMREEEHSLKIEVEYALELNYEHTSNCVLSMDVTSKGYASLHL